MNAFLLFVGEMFIPKFMMKREISEIELTPVIVNYRDLIDDLSTKEISYGIYSSDRFYDLKMAIESNLNYLLDNFFSIVMKDNDAHKVWGILHRRQVNSLIKNLPPQTITKDSSFGNVLLCLPKKGKDARSIQELLVANGAVDLDRYLSSLRS